MPFDFGARVQIPQGLTSLDVDLAGVRRGLRKMASEVRSEARRELNRDEVSKPGEPPGRRTGTLRSSIQIITSRARTEKRTLNVWARLQYSSRLTAKNGAFYAAPLMYGRKDGRLQARLNVLPAVQEARSELYEERMEQLLIDSIKGWGD